MEVAITLTGPITVNVKYINLFVDPTNSRAIALYRRIGFVEIDERDQLTEMRITFA